MIAVNRMVLARKFKKKKLPRRYRWDNDLFKLIKCMKKLTGGIAFSEEICGTGFVQRIRFVRGKCPCSSGQCLDSRNKFAIVTVSTVIHNFDNYPDRGERGDLRHQFDQEPRSAKMILGYESNGNDVKRDPLSDLRKLYGYRLVETDKDLDIDSDWCCLEFVSHEVRMVEKLNKTLTKYQKLQAKVYQTYKDRPDNLVVVVGHPKGGPMQISIGGKIQEYEVLKEIRDGQRWGLYHYNAPTEKGSSGSPVFVLGQPISGFGYWFGHPHNHSTKYDVNGRQNNMSSIGVEYLVI